MGFSTIFVDTRFCIITKIGVGNPSNNVVVGRVSYNVVVDPSHKIGVGNPSNKRQVI